MPSHWYYHFHNEIKEIHFVKFVVMVIVVIFFFLTIFLYALEIHWETNIITYLKYKLDKLFYQKSTKITSSSLYRYKKKCIYIIYYSMHNTFITSLINLKSPYSSSLFKQVKFVIYIFVGNYQCCCRFGLKLLKLYRFRSVINKHFRINRWPPLCVKNPFQLPYLNRPKYMA